jgi:hypothetical protein
LVEGLEIIEAGVVERQVDLGEETATALDTLVWGRAP